MRVPAPGFTLWAEPALETLVRICVFPPAPQVGFPSVPTVSGSSCNFEILLPLSRAHGPTAPTAILTQGSQTTNVSSLTDSKFKPREMTGGTVRVRTKWNPRLSWPGPPAFQHLLGTLSSLNVDEMTTHTDCV
jgi:hypothetical protein